jgi:hypothetical protein
LSSATHPYDEITWREDANLDPFWIRDKSLEVSDVLEDPGAIAEEKTDDLEAVLEEFAAIAADLRDIAVQCSRVHPGG